MIYNVSRNRTLSGGISPVISSIPSVPLDIHVLMDACELTSAAASFKIVWGKSVVFSGRRFSRWRLFLDNLTYCCPFVPIRLSRGSWSRWRRSRGSWRSEAWLWRKRCEGKQVEISHSYICCIVFFSSSAFSRVAKCIRNITTDSYSVSLITLTTPLLTS